MTSSLLLMFFPLFWFFHRQRQHRVQQEKEEEEEEEEETAVVEINRCCGDRLSRLPEDILRHILSFLTTDAAVRTSLLSTRWRSIWASVPVLLLDRRRFRAPYPDNFVRFVNAAMARRRNGFRIDAFRLTWHDGFQESQAADWLSYAFFRSVREIKLDVRPGAQCLLPMHIFRRCPSLEVCRLELPMQIWPDRPRPPLRTFHPTDVRLPTSTNLAKLRVLDIKYITDTDNLLGKLISACPVLEDLTMHVSRDIVISTPNLRALTLVCTRESNASSTARVFAPRLTRLSCSMLGSPEILLDGLCCPVHAYLLVSEKEIENKKNIVGLLRSLRPLETLKLDGQFVEALSTVQDLSMQMEFSNLKYLWVKAPLDSHNAKTIFMLLEGCPNLETLVIHNSKVSKQASRVAAIFQLPRFVAAKVGHKDDRIHREHKYSCSLSKLKQIKVNYFLGDDDELEFLNSLLWNAASLQRVHTNYRNISSYEADHVRVNAMLHSMRRASTTVKIFPGYF